MDMPDGFALAAITAREDPRDAFVSNRYRDARATCRRAPSSARRACGAKRSCASAIRSSRSSRCAATSTRGCASSTKASTTRSSSPRPGLKRLGFGERIAALLEPDESLPAPGQGALALECRADRADVIAALAPLADCGTTLATTAERAFSRALGGSCHTPLAAYAEWEEGTLWLRGLLASRDGREILRGESRGRRRRRRGRGSAGAGAGRRFPGAAARRALIADRAAERASHDRAFAENAPRAAGPLAGVGVIVTRPARQAAGLARQLAALRRHADRLSGDRRSCRRRIARRSTRCTRRSTEYDIAIFVSANAVEYGVPAPRSWPATLMAFAPGPGTAAALAATGIADVRDSRIDVRQRRTARVAGIARRRRQARRDLSRRRRARRSGRHAARTRRDGDLRRVLSPRGARNRRGGSERSAARRARACADADVERRPRQPVRAARAGDLRGCARCPPSCRIRASPSMRASLGFDAVETGGGDAGLIAGLLEWFAAHPLYPYDNAP